MDGGDVECVQTLLSSVCVRDALCSLWIGSPIRAGDPRQEAEGAFKEGGAGGHASREGSAAGAAAPVSGSKNRSRHAPQDCPCDCVHPRTRVDAGAAPESGKTLCMHRNR